MENRKEITNYFENLFMEINNLINNRSTFNDGIKYLKFLISDLEDRGDKIEDNPILKYLTVGLIELENGGKFNFQITL